jgi:hypothetical protein
VIHQTFHIRSLRKSHNAPASPAVNRNKKQWSLAQNRKKLDGSLHAFVRRVICHIAQLSQFSGNNHESDRLPYP